MIYANQLRKGTVFMFKERLHICLEYQHHKPGKGGAMVRTKLKDLIKGSIFDFTFNPEDRIDDVQIARKECEFLYNDGEKFHFMDHENYDQFTISVSELKEEAMYLLEGAVVDIDFFEENPIFVHPPMFIELEVTETDPGLRGDTVSGGTKPAVLATGLKVNVPLFINIGDILKVDTRTNTYVERVKKGS